MKLKELAVKPKLIKVELDTPQILELYDEPLEFWMYDRLNLPTFFKFASIKDNQEELFDIVKELILDEDGSRALQDDEMLPLEVLVAVIEGVVKQVGNLTPQTSKA